MKERSVSSQKLPNPPQNPARSLPNQRTGNPAPHPVKQECRRQRPEHPATQTSSMQQSCHGTSQDGPHLRRHAHSASLPLPSLSPTGTQNSSTPATTCRRLRQPTRPGGPCGCVPPTRDRSIPFHDEHQCDPIDLISSPSGSSVRPQCTHECNIHCQLPPPPRRETSHRPTSSLRASATPNWVKSKSLIITFVVTRPPASRQTVTTTLQSPPSSSQHLTVKITLRSKEEIYSATIIWSK